VSRSSPGNVNTEGLAGAESHPTGRRESTLIAWGGSYDLVVVALLRAVVRHSGGLCRLRTVTYQRPRALSLLT
jgi:hypothetical protein